MTNVCPIFAEDASVDLAVEVSPGTGLYGPLAGSGSDLPGFRPMDLTDMPSLSSGTLMGNSAGVGGSPGAIALGAGLGFSGGSLTAQESVSRAWCGF